MAEWIRKHSPLIIVVVVAGVLTGLMPVFDHPFVTALASNVWGVAVLLVAFDVTPRDAQEKQERV